MTPLQRIRMHTPKADAAQALAVIENRAKARKAADLESRKVRQIKSNELHGGKG